MSTLGLALTLFVAFAGMAWGIDSRALRAFDAYATLPFRKHGVPAQLAGPDWLPETLRNLTSLGSISLLTMVVLVTATSLLILKKAAGAQQLVVAFVGGLLILNLMKWGFARPRPDSIADVGRVFTTSFPSGHAMLAATVYLTLAAILARELSDRILVAFIVACCLALTAIVGVSRIYLGFHYPSDVLAGWFLGAAWSLSCGVAMHRHAWHATDRDTRSSKGIRDAE